MIHDSDVAIGRPGNRGSQPSLCEETDCDAHNDSHGALGAQIVAKATVFEKKNAMGPCRQRAIVRRHDECEGHL
jgi:hypothetical protein